MATTVVGVFDEFSEAQEACKKLQTLGIDLQGMRINSSPADKGVDETAPLDKEHEGGIRGFFASLFGSDDADETSGHYSEAVRRGSAVLTVSLADDSQVDGVSDVLEDCGAIDIDERVEQWRSTGYDGYDADAGPFAGGDRPREREAARAATSPMAPHLREDPATMSRMGASQAGAAAGRYSGPERRRQPGRNPAGMERRAGL